jgi:hypothetical protein
MVLDSYIWVDVDFKRGVATLPPCTRACTGFARGMIILSGNPRFE